MEIIIKNGTKDTIYFSTDTLVGSGSLIPDQTANLKGSGKVDYVNTVEPNENTVGGNFVAQEGEFYTILGVKERRI
ncbi:hypothetical protein [uncultured Kordia sp.]|uniref:hypothetical protein n=1 Tax=uncultured Kordia sp. TaxID=507699 RepID=UPI0026255E55|nr:hypothetical protein [uncultured Kordia sp.]